MYQLTKTGVLRLADGASIPNDDENLDWQAFVAWRDAGGVVSTPTAAPSVTPSVVTRRQALLALLAAGKLEQIEVLIASAPRAVQIAWEAAGTFERDNPLIASLAPTVGMSEADLDALFIEAAQL